MLPIEEVYDVTENSFKEAIVIYMESIPAAERQTLGTIKERITTRKEHLLIGRLNEEIVCMALIWPL